MATNFRIYSNGGSGGPINYASPIGVSATLTFTTGALPYPADIWFGVRAFDTASGLEEGNLDARVRLILDDQGRDITNRPGPPIGLTARPGPAGSIVVTWAYPPILTGGVPIGFHVYLYPPAPTGTPGPFPGDYWAPDYFPDAYFPGAGPPSGVAGGPGPGPVANFLDPFDLDFAAASPSDYDPFGLGWPPLPVSTSGSTGGPYLPPSGFTPYYWPRDYWGSPSLGLAPSMFDDPALDVPYTPGRLDYTAVIPGLVGGRTYLVAVRAFNATAEEPNTNTVSVVADATPPLAVASLTAELVA